MEGSGTALASNLISSNPDCVADTNRFVVIRAPLQRRMLRTEKNTPIWALIVLEDARIGVLGFEPRLTDSESARIRVYAGDSGTLSDCAAAGAAVDPENAPIDPDLQAIIERWADLPDAVKGGIVAMVRLTVG